MKTNALSSVSIICSLLIAVAVLCFECPALGQSACAAVFGSKTTIGHLNEDRWGLGNVDYFYEGGRMNYNRTNRGLKIFEQDGGRIFEQFVNDLVVNRSSLLDAGAGDGRLVYELRERGVDAIGLDIALKPEQKKEKFFVERDIRKTGFAENQFDKVLSSFAVFHYPMPLEFRLLSLRELVRVTKPGGEIMIVGFQAAKLDESRRKVGGSLDAYYAWKPKAEKIQRAEVQKYLKELVGIEVVEFVPFFKEGGLLLLRKKRQ